MCQFVSSGPLFLFGFHMIRQSQLKEGHQNTYRIQCSLAVTLSSYFRLHFDKLAVVTHFNQFFSNIADKLVSNLPPVKDISVAT